MPAIHAHMLKKLVCKSSSLV